MTQTEQMKTQIRKHIQDMITKNGVYYTVGYLESAILSQVHSGMTDEQVKNMNVLFGANADVAVERT
jgi:hypothetical protein